MTLGERIKAARKAAGMTQEALGKKLGVSGSYIAQYETNKRRPKPATLLKIADALDVMPFELYPANVRTELTFLMDEGQKKEYKSVYDPKEHPSNRPVDPLLELIWFAGTLDLERYQRGLSCMKALSGRTPNDLDGRIIAAMCKLNEEGRRKAVERVEELTEVARFQLEDEQNTDKTQEST